MNCIHWTITGEEAEEILKTQGKHGSFLIRPSSEKDKYSISVRKNDEILHIKINNNGEFFEIFAGEEFSSLKELAFHYSQGPGKSKLISSPGDSQIELIDPIPASDERRERWFHSNITLKEAEDILKNNNKEGSFLVRESEKGKKLYRISYLYLNDVLHINITKEKGLYFITQGEMFGSLVKLIQHYRNNIFEVKFKNQKVEIKLKQPVLVRKVPMKNINAQIAELSKTFIIHNKTSNGFIEEFEYIQQHDNQFDQTTTIGQNPKIKSKNRYKNILPYDQTRVILKSSNPKFTNDYINANYIKINSILPDYQKKYIATQGCVSASVADFWSMIWQEDARVIIMTTELVEKSKNKCFKYWEENVPLELEGGEGLMKITFEKEINKKDYNLRYFTISCKNLERKIIQFQYLHWPDKCTPKESDGVVDFVLEINSINQELMKCFDQKTKNEIDSDGYSLLDHSFSKPWIVHCSAGIGRTGTFIMIDILINLIIKNGLENIKIDIPRILIELRNQRAGLVQIDKQYIFVYSALQTFINKKLDLFKNGQFTSITEFQKTNDDYKLYENSKF